MKVRSLIPVAALLISTASLLATPAPTKSFKICGPNMLSTSASNVEVVSAVHSIHKKLSKQPVRPDGTIVDKSFTQDVIRGEAAGKLILRYKAGFETKTAGAVRIDYITKPHEETIVFFESNDPSATEEIRNEFVAALEQQGVRQAE